jgi:hypothetical protein
MLQVNKQDGDFLYRQVIDLISENIDSGTLRPGDRLPSLRKMSQTVGVSIPTVRQAYIELERQRRVESRPQSGFYVRHVAANDIVLPTPSYEGDPIPLACRGLMERVYNGINDPDLVPLGIEPGILGDARRAGAAATDRLSLPRHHRRTGRSRAHRHYERRPGSTAARTEVGCNRRRCHRRGDTHVPRHAGTDRQPGHARDRD